MRLNSSFRDPSGFLFYENGELFRQINFCYKENYDFFMNSRLYQRLVDEKLLIPHQEMSNNTKSTYKIIKPQKIDFISYPYEWCFSQLKDAALLTLQQQKLALENKMTLKDASAYNVQFLSGKPIFIDTLSFEKYQEGQTWKAYRQFCQHFLAPLTLMSYTDIRLSSLLKINLDGIPLDLAINLLPLKVRLNSSLYIHLYLHAKAQKKYQNNPKTDKKMSKFALLALISSLESTINNLKLKVSSTVWSDYYSNTNYSDQAFESKKQIISEFLKIASPDKVWDLGANTGVFSRLASKMNIPTFSFDFDPLAVELNYLQLKEKKEANILPLLMDLTNPSAAIGWNNQERMSLIERGPADLVMSLALIHHLAIGNNLPLSKIAEYFSKICNWLIIEWIPKEDSNVQKMLSSREDIFLEYNLTNFEKELKEFFKIILFKEIINSNRKLYLFQNLNTLIKDDN